MTGYKDINSSRYTFFLSYSCVYAIALNNIPKKIVNRNSRKVAACATNYTLLTSYLTLATLKSFLDGIYLRYLPRYPVAICMLKTSTTPQSLESLELEIPSPTRNDLHLFSTINHLHQSPHMLLSEYGSNPSMAVTSASLSSVGV